MSRFVAIQIVGMAFLVAGGQGLIRILVHTDERGFLAWLPGGTTAITGAYAALAVAGIGLAAWAERRRRSAD